MSGLFQPFVDNAFMRHALLAGVLVSILCACVGTFMVLRGLAFVGDALAHGVLPGIAIATLIGAPAFAGAAVGALVMMGGVNVVQRRTRLSPDTAVGLLFVGMLSLGVIITSRSASFSGDITHILFGEILSVDTAHLVWIGVTAFVVGVTTWALRRPFLLLSIDNDLEWAAKFAPLARESRHHRMVWVSNWNGMLPLPPNCEVALIDSAPDGSRVPLIEGLRSRVPAKITSSIREPRRDLALCSPSTQLMASLRLDFPQPFGPTMAVTPEP